MSDHELFAPFECAKVQQPAQPHPDLHLQFLSILDQKHVERDTIAGPHPGYYTGATKNVVGPGGTELLATFTAATEGGDSMKLTSIENLKTGQKDSYSTDSQTPGRATWTINRDALVPAVKTYESEDYLPGGLPTFRARTEGAIMLNSLEMPARLASKWEVEKPDGTLSVEAKFNPKNHSVASESGTITDNNGQVVSRFRYTFNPDGKATSCARNATPDAQTADHLEWSLKLAP